MAVVLPPSALDRIAFLFNLIGLDSLQQSGTLLGAFFREQRWLSSSGDRALSLRHCNRRIFRIVRCQKVSDCGTLGCIGNSTAKIEVDGTDTTIFDGKKLSWTCSYLSFWSDPHFGTVFDDDSGVESWSQQTSFFLEVESPKPVKGTTNHDLRMKIGAGCFTRRDTGVWWSEALADTSK